MHKDDSQAGQSAALSCEAQDFLRELEELHKEVADRRQRLRQLTQMKNDLSAQLRSRAEALTRVQWRRAYATEELLRTSLQVSAMTRKTRARKAHLVQLHGYLQTLTERKEAFARAAQKEAALLPSPRKNSELSRCEGGVVYSRVGETEAAGACREPADADRGTHDMSDTDAAVLEALSMLLNNTALAAHALQPLLSELRALCRALSSRCPLMGLTHRAPELDKNTPLALYRDLPRSMLPCVVGYVKKHATPAMSALEERILTRVVHTACIHNG